jgi:hypothetical protein
MSARPRPIPTTPAVPRPDAPPPEPAEDTLPTLRQILSNYRRHGTLPGQIASAQAPPREAVRRLGSLRELFLEASAEPKPPGADSRSDRSSNPRPKR